MSEEVKVEVAPVVAPAPSVPVIETPVAAPAPAPVVKPVAAAPVAPAPVVAPDKAPEAAPEAPTAPEPTPTVLGDALKDKPVEAAPDAPKEEPAPKAEEKEEGQSDEPAPPPTFEEFRLPEGTQAAPELISEFTGILGEFETDTKADHAKVQEFGQKAVDFYTREVQKEIQKVNELYHQTWEKTKTQWKDDFLGDTQIGGNRAQTTLDSALNCIRACGGTPEEQTEFRRLMDQSGLGNNKVMIRILANAGRALSEGRPLAATTPISAPKSKVQTLYGRR